MLRKGVQFFKRILSVPYQKGTLVYVGLHKGGGFEAVFNKFRKCYGFEANPEIFEILKKRYKGLPNIHLYNCAVTDTDGEVHFNISSNDGASSSVGTFDDDWTNYKSGQINMEKTIKVPSVNLFNFINREKIGFIDSYISDIQGLDLTVLKTLKPLIETKRIGYITCEVTKDKYRNIYKDLPDNSETGFNEILGENYMCVARGWGVLQDGNFSDVPEEWWEMDCKWKVKS